MVIIKYYNYNYCYSSLVITEQYQEPNLFFQFTKVNFFNGSKNQIKQTKDWYRFDKIILKKIKDIQSKGVQVNEEINNIGSNYYNKKRKESSSVLRFQNSILNSFKDTRE